jgi:peroxiredoxin
VEESQEHTAEGLPVGSLAPDFALTDVAGATHTLQSLRARGLPVVLTFMDRSCGPCKTLSPELAQWQATLSDRVTIVAVISGSSEDNAGVWDEYELDLLLYDAPDEMTGNFGLRSTPTALIVNPDGQIASAPYGGVHGVEVIVRLALRQGVEPSAAEAAFAFPRVVEVEPSRA